MIISRKEKSNDDRKAHTVDTQDLRRKLNFERMRHLSQGHDWDVADVMQVLVDEGIIEDTGTANIGETRTVVTVASRDANGRFRSRKQIREYEANVAVLRLRRRMRLTPSQAAAARLGALSALEVRDGEA